MKNIPKKIYLQIGDCDCEDWNDVYPLNGITWCIDKISDNDIEFIRKEQIDTEKIMQQWDFWRKRIAEGDKSSAPSDWFGSVIDTFRERIAALLDT